jgi:tetratricopeptide (TPR) repeat protein
MKDGNSRKSIRWSLILPLAAALTFVGVGIVSLARDWVLQLFKPRLASLIALVLHQPLPVQIGIGLLTVLVCSLAVWVVVLASRYRTDMRTGYVTSLLEAVRDAVRGVLLELRDEWMRPTRTDRPVGQPATSAEDGESQSWAVTSPHPQVHFPPPIDQNKLPDPPKHLVGRKRDLEWLVQRLLAPQDAKSRVTVVKGMLGVGKTALVTTAVQRVQELEPKRFAAGVAAYHCVDDKDDKVAILILQKILERFDAQRRRPPPGIVTDVAQSLLRGKDALIIVDNVGQDLDIGEVIHALNVDGPHLLFTMREGISRNALTAVEQGAVLELGLLSAEDALDLFAKSYGRQGISDLTPDESLQARRIVGTFECHTLSIQYIAAYARDSDRPLAMVAEELENQRGQCGQYMNTPPPYTLAIQQSLSSLPDDKRDLLVALAAFAGEEYGRDAVIDVGTGIGINRPGDAVDELVRRFLVMKESNERLPRQSYWERLRVHSTLRAHFRVLFEGLPPDTRFRAHRAVAAHYADRVELVAARMRDSQIEQQTQEYRNEQRVLTADPKNITGALEWAKSNGKDELVLKLCHGMSSYWRDRWQTTEALKYLPWGIAAAKTLARKSRDPIDRRRLANLEFIYASVLRRIGDLSQAERVFYRVLDVRRREEDRHREAEVWYQLGIISVMRRRLGKAERYFKRCLAVAQELDNRRDLSVVLSQLGRVARARGQLDDAEKLFNHSLALATDLPDQRLQGVLLGYLGRIARARGQLKVAEDLFNQSLALARDQDEPDERGEGRVLSHLGRIARTRGQLEDAEKYFNQALLIAQRVMDRQSEGACLGYLGRIALARAQDARKDPQTARAYLTAARVYFEESKRRAQQIQDQRGVSISLSQLGRVAFEQGRLWEAWRQFHQSLRLTRRIGDRQNEGVNLYRLGRLAELRGWKLWANRLYGRAWKIAEQVDNQADIADALLALGRIRVAHRSTRQDGCAKLKDAERIYDAMGMHKRAEARRELERAGCD